ncbi:MAG: DUF4349 domain-containing protein [Fimbriimonadaceae bacterium]
MVHTGSVSVTVDGVKVARETVTQLAEQMGGYVETATGNDMDSRYANFSLTLRVPAESYEALIAGVYEIGTVNSESRQVEDVTRQLVDLEARLTTLRAEEISLNRLLERAEQMEDIIRLSDRLQDVREQIEVAMGRRKTLRESVAMATLEVYLQQSPASLAAEGFDPNWMQDTWAQATTALSALGRAIVRFGIWLLVLSPLWLPAVLVVVWLGLRAGRKSEAKATGAAKNAPPPPPA